MKAKPNHESTQSQLTINPPDSSRRWLKLFLKTGSAIGLGLFLLLIIGIGFGQWWAKRHLAPLVAQELTKSLKRPIDLGKIEDIWLNEVRLGNTKIPVNGNDLTQVEVPQVVINFNPFKLLLDRTLKLDIRLVNPRLSVAQNALGDWVNIPQQDKKTPPPLKIEIGKIQLDEAQVTIVPYSKSPRPITISKLNLQADVNDSQDRVSYRGDARFNQSGQVQIDGNSTIASGETQLSVKGQQLDAAAATQIVKIPQVAVINGTVDGEAQIAVQPQKYLRINSNLLVRNGKIVVDNVPRSLDEINGFIQISERDVNLKNVTGKYDRVAGLINGNLNYNTGFNINAKTGSVSLPDVLKSIDIKSPLPVAGAVVAQLQLTGKLDRPVLAGKFNNSQIGQVDRVQIDRISGNFRLADRRIEVDAIAQPKLGGKVTTQGEIQLLKTPQVRFDVQGRLPGDLLSQLYGARLPSPVKIGETSVRGTIGGTGADIYTNLRVNAPLASYPASADLQITPQGKVLVRGANVAVAGGKIAATGEITKTNWQLNLQPQNLDTQQLAKIGGINLAANYGGKLRGNIQAQGLNNDLEIDRIQAIGTLNLQLAAGQVTASQLRIDRGKWQANVGSNALDLQRLIISKPLDANLPQSGLAPSAIAGSDLQIPAGIASGNFQVGGNSLKQITPDNIVARGQGSVQLKAGKIQSNNLNISNGNWQGLFTTRNFQLAEFSSQIRGRLTGKFNLTGNLQQFTPASIRGMGSGTIDLAQGKVVGNNLQIDRGKFQGNLQATSLVLGGLAPQVPLKFRKARIDSNVQIAGNIQSLKPEYISVVGTGELSLADGKVRATDLKLEDGNFSSNLAIANFKIGSINTQLSPQLQAGKITGNFNVAGNIARLTPTAIRANGNSIIALTNGGKITANNIKLTTGQWESDLAFRGFKLGLVNQNLPLPIQAGLLSGNFRAAGNFNYPELGKISARGNGQIRSILGGNIRVNDLAVNNGKWQSQVIVDRLNIGELVKSAPQPIGIAAKSQNRLTGQLSADWQIGGDLLNNNLASLQVLGQTKLTDLQVGAIKFDRNLSGNIQANPGQGVDINFAGTSDRLALSLDRNLQPQSFEIQQQQIAATGNVDGKLLAIDLQRLPLSLLQPWIPKGAGIQAYRFDGIAKGNLDVNLTDYQVTARELEITKPTFGAFEGDRLLANFRYANGQLAVNNTELQRGTRTYRIVAASLTPGASTPTFQAKFQVPSGNIEDIRNLLQIFSTQDVFTPLNRRRYGTAADLNAQTEKIANRPQPLYNELRRLSELRRWLDRETALQQDNMTIPDAGNLQGEFSGDIAIASSPQAGLTSDFNIVGANWQLERYRLDTILAKGNWRNGKLRLEPLNLTIQDSQIDIAGDFGLFNQNATVNVRNFPVESLTSLTTIPVDVRGGVNLFAQISGNLANPRASGEISLSNGQLNNTKLQNATGSFNYWDGRLNFLSDATFADRPLIDREDRLKITGSIPYQLPFALKPPATNDIKIDLSLQNQGLQILDVFSQQQLRWIDGQGKISLRIDGKMQPNGEPERLTASGIANIANGRIKSVALPEPLTDINGDIVFDFDRIDVQKLTGKFNRGQVTVAGIIPIADSFSIEPSKQLSVQMDGIAINLKDKYNGDVNGKLTLLGTALTPILTGNVQLSNGQVFLPDTSSTTTTTVLGIQPAIPAAPPNANALQLRNLQVTLGDNLQITRAPILNFVATGKIDLDGTIDNPRPFGQVQLQKGSVNLFTTQFRLASGAQTADFFPTLGADPVLNLRLFARTLESATNPLIQKNSNARIDANGEINRPADFYTTNFGSVQTVQVEARIAGLASQLTQRLELTSSPARSQPEIVLLLGGALAERLTSGGDLGLGAISLASSNLLNSIQDRIGDVLNLSDFRLYPAITKGSTTSANSTFGIAAEIGTEITPKFSASVFKILTNSESPFYSLRYRVSDQILIRGSTNLFGENRAIVEFEQRF
ncbi:translocation/assembly module TamB domain-containing protein [Chamaesiphon sp.]|uniref:translocation/assembly module TamB domain-containing protein n=1 Tax=Chamaesiphon sp. TaxID=2814140 RepID=UPI003592F066